MIRKLYFIITAFLAFSSYRVAANDPTGEKPRLIVGIVVDQMRYDYITRYWNKFGEHGFKKLVKEGFNCSNTHFSYVPTYTGPGHASIYTGTTPAVHGIIGNNWYSRAHQKNIYVTEDPSVNSVGTTAGAGKMSPIHLISTTISDELRLASNLRSKVVGVAIKDRGAILPAGHAANAAYWFESVTGNWISSSWYMNNLPGWVNEFNAKKMAESLIKKPWTTLHPISSYAESTADDVLYEDIFPGETKPVFPHSLNENSAAGYDLIRYSPYGNVITKDFAIAAMYGEQLGKDEFTDILAISFSSPDYIGHQFGTHSIEIQDNYLRLDQDLADLIRQIEVYTGKNNVLFFLTADHAAIPNVQFMKDQKIPAGIFNIAGTADSLNKHLAQKYGDKKWILEFDNDQIYFDHLMLEQNKISLAEITEVTRQFLMHITGVAAVISADDLSRNEYTWGIRSHAQKGFYARRSGDVVMILEPGLVEYKLKGTTHGAGYTYDTHVPLLFYGWKIKSGATPVQVDITDIAPTLSQILGIQTPNGCTGNVIERVLELK